MEGGGGDKGVREIQLFQVIQGQEVPHALIRHLHVT